MLRCRARVHFASALVFAARRCIRNSPKAETEQLKAATQHLAEVNAQTKRLEEQMQDLKHEIRKQRPSAATSSTTEAVEPMSGVTFMTYAVLLALLLALLLTLQGWYDKAVARYIATRDDIKRSIATGYQRAVDQKDAVVEGVHSAGATGKEALVKGATVTSELVQGAGVVGKEALSTLR